VYCKYYFWIAKVIKIFNLKTKRFIHIMNLSIKQEQSRSQMFLRSKKRPAVRSKLRIWQ